MHNVYLLNGIYVGYSTVAHVPLPGSCGPDAGLGLVVDGHFGTVRAQVEVVAGVGLSGAVGTQSEEPTHVGDFGPGDVTAVLAETP